MNDLNIIANVLFEQSDIIEIRFLKPYTKPIQWWVTAAELPDLYNVLQKFNEQVWNVHFGVNPRKAAYGAKADDVALARCVFVDFDDKTDPMIRPSCNDGAGLGRYEFIISRIIDAKLPEPSLVVSSGHGMHCYWRLDTPIHDAGEFRDAQQNLIDLLMTDDVKDFPRVMRLPPFKNVKYPDNPKECFVLYPTRTA